MIIHFPTVGRQKSRAEAPKNIEKMSLLKNQRKKMKSFGILNLFLSMENGSVNSTWDCYEH